MVKEGYWYGVPLIVAGGALLGFGASGWGVFFYVVAAIVLVLALLVLNFFRDPDRRIPSEKGAIISPADGRIVEVRDLSGSPAGRRRISIFMSPLDVHVNRSPVAGTIQEVRYQKGSFRMASEPRASIENEQNVFTIKGEAGEIEVRQVAGVLARRIVFWKKPGDVIQRGERVGMIKFGSRVDVVLSAEANLVVKVGDRVQAGSTILGYDGSNEGDGNSK